MFGVLSLLGRTGCDGFCGGVFDVETSTFRCASSGGTAGSCFVLEVADCCPREGSLCRSFAFVDTDAADGATCLSTGLCFERFASGRTVELDDEVEDSRTGCNAGRSDSPRAVWVMIGFCFNEGVLTCLARDPKSLVETRPGEYDEAELGVGTWLNGDSVYLVDGVADGA